MSTRALPIESRADSYSRLSMALDAGAAARKNALEKRAQASPIIGAPSGAVMMPRPVVASVRRHSTSSVVDELINKLSSAMVVPPTETVGCGISVHAVPNDLWTSTTLEDGATTNDHACFAYNGVFHPHPTESGQLACVAVGDIVGKSVEEVQAGETTWLEAGFELGCGWVVRNEGPENVWRRSSDLVDF